MAGQSPTSSTLRKSDSFRFLEEIEAENELRSIFTRNSDLDAQSINSGGYAVLKPRIIRFNSYS